MTFYALDTAKSDFLNISTRSNMSGEERSFSVLSDSLESVAASRLASMEVHTESSGDVDRIDVFNADALMFKADGGCADDATCGINWNYKGVGWSYGGFCATVSIKCLNGQDPTFEDGSAASALPLGKCAA